jgi:hypothetical protein
VVFLGIYKRLGKLWVRARSEDWLKVTAVFMAWIMFRIMIKVRLRVMDRVNFSSKFGDRTKNRVNVTGFELLCSVRLMFKARASVRLGIGLGLGNSYVFGLWLA